MDKDASGWESRLSLELLLQPDDTTCGPTCLQAVYRFYGENLPLERVIEEVVPLETGGTLAVWLACHALKLGYPATIYTYNLQVFDPTWFSEGGPQISERLEEQLKCKKNPKLTLVSQAYQEFFALGGRLKFQELHPRLIRKYLNRQIPILTGLSATYLYGCAREYQDDYDDIRGEPMGHFVILCGYDRERREVHVADPLGDNPGFGAQHYRVGIDRLIGAILLGIVTYDANLLIIEPKTRKPR